MRNDSLKRKWAEKWASLCKDQKNVNGNNRRWRTGWDSNPRYAFTHTRVPGVRLKPLGHLSRGIAEKNYRGWSGAIYTEEFRRINRNLSEF